MEEKDFNTTKPGFMSIKPKITAVAATKTADMDKPIILD